MDWVRSYLKRLMVRSDGPGPHPPQREVHGWVETDETTRDYRVWTSPAPPYETEFWWENVELTFHVQVWVDAQNRLHREDGPAAEGHWFWHGVEVRAYVITEPQVITLGEIREEPDERVRAVLRERYGVLRYLSDSRAEPIHVDTVPVEAADPTGGHLTRVLVKAETGEPYLIASDGSTGQVHAMRVPAGCSTCKEAYRALSGREHATTIMEA